MVINMNGMVRRGDVWSNVIIVHLS